MSDKKTSKPGTVKPQDEHASSEPITTLDEHASGEPVTTLDEHASTPTPK